MVERKNRNSAYELLRIVAMFLIILHHFAAHGDFEYESVTGGRLWFDLIYMGGQIGVDVFVLISGYFLVNNKNGIEIKKVIKLWGIILFYSLSTFILLIISGYSVFSMSELLKAGMPLIFQKWWFASAYFILYLIHPYLNRFLYTLDDKTYKKMIIEAVILWSVIPTLTTKDIEQNAIIWFVVLYLIGGFVRFYGTEHYSTKKVSLILIITIGINYFSTVCFSFWGINNSFFYDHIFYFYSREKITTLVISVCIFVLFGRLDVKNKYINIIASGTFGCYLIHEEGNVSSILMRGVSKGNNYKDSLFLIPYSIIFCMTLYIIMLIIDISREYICNWARNVMIHVDRNQINKDHPRISDE